MDENKGQELDINMFFGRKNVVVGELDLAVEVLAAALGVELDGIVRHEMDLVLMLKTMEARLCRIDETARQMLVFRAIVELHVPTHRDEEHHKCHHEGNYLQPLLFHAAKIVKNDVWMARWSTKKLPEPKKHLEN